MNLNRISNVRQKQFTACALLVVCVLLIASYSNSFYSPPALDDFHSFIDEPLVRTDDWSFQHMKDLAKTKFGWSRWVPMVALSWDIWWGKGELLTLHLTNFVVHLLCFFSIFFLINRVSRWSEEEISTPEHLPDSLTLSVWVAALWALNPVQTNGVTYLVQRMASFVTLFFVLSVAFYVAGRMIISRKKILNAEALLCFLCSFASMILAFLSKENSYMLPVMLLLTEAWFFQPDLFKKLVLFCRRRKLLAGLMLAVVLAVVVHSFVTLTGGYAKRHFTMDQRLLTEARIVVWYISLLLWPNPDRLSLEHHVELSTSIFHPPSTFLSLLVLVFLAAGTVWYRRRYPLITYGMLWFFINIFIESTFIPLELVFEHRLYLPSVGLILSAVLIAYNVLRAFSDRSSAEVFRTVTWCAVAILASALTLSTFARNQVWEDKVALCKHDLEKHPLSPRTNANLAVALSRSGSHDEAIEAARRAIELGKRGYEAYGVAANVIVLSLYHLDRIQEAIEEGQKYLKERPNHSDATAVPMLSLNIARIQEYIGEFEESYESAQRALAFNQIMYPKVLPQFEVTVAGFLEKLLLETSNKNIDFDKDGSPDPGPVPIKTWVAQCFLRLGYRDMARSLVQESITANPEDPVTNDLLTSIKRHDVLNQVQLDKKDFTHKYVYHPFSPFNGAMALAYIINKHRILSPLTGFGEALLEYALALRPDSPDPYLLKGWYSHKKGDAKQAILAAETALELDSEYARAWLGLGFFLTQAERKQEAVAAFEKTLELYPGYPERRKVLDIVAILENHSGDESIGSTPNGHAGPKASFPFATSHQGA